jgi:cytoskeletal protein CcmA (bactofilin family)
MFEGNGTDGTTAGPGTVVGANVKLTGTISDVNDIIVHGTVEGEVVSDKTVTITETASVKGPVTAEFISVSGKVNGSVTARQKLELQPTANINGSISTKELIIKSGAIFNGKSTMASTGDAGQPKGSPGKPSAKKTDDDEDTRAPAAQAEGKIGDVLEMPAPAAPAVEIEE